MPADRVQAAAEIRASVPGARVRPMRLDLASLKSVAAFAAEFKRAKLGRLDVLLNNAGIMACPYGTTEEGFELQFGTASTVHFDIAVF